jgi:hypothetical protein
MGVRVAALLLVAECGVLYGAHRTERSSSKRDTDRIEIHGEYSFNKGTKAFRQP